MTDPWTTADVRRLARHADLPLPDDRLAVVAATAGHIAGVVRALRTVDLGETLPAATYHPSVASVEEGRACSPTS